MTSVLIKGEIWTERETCRQGEDPVTMEDWSDAPLSQGTPKTVSKPPGAGKRQDGFQR